jgi:hypothetical protein
MAADVHLWDEYHKEQLELLELLTKEQRLKLPEAFKALREAEQKKIATDLGLDDGHRRRLAELVEKYEPQFRPLVVYKQQGVQVGPKEAADIHKKIAELRLDFLAAVEDGLTPAQRDRLAGLVRAAPGLPGYLQEEAALPFVLMTSGLRHFAQPEYLNDLADKVGLAGEAKEKLIKAEAEKDRELRKLGDKLQKVHREEREAIEKVLTDEQRARWKGLRKARGEEK